MANKKAVAYDRKTGRIVHVHYFFVESSPRDSSADIGAQVLRDIKAMPGLASLK